MNIILITVAIAAVIIAIIVVKFFIFASLETRGVMREHYDKMLLHEKTKLSDMMKERDHDIAVLINYEDRWTEKEQIAIKLRWQHKLDMIVTNRDILLRQMMAQKDNLYGTGRKNGGPDSQKM